jgi:hypothetical protein
LPDQREMFEKWAKPKGFDLQRHMENGFAKYDSATTQNSWEAYMQGMGDFQLHYWHPTTRSFLQRHGLLEEFQKEAWGAILLDGGVMRMAKHEPIRDLDTAIEGLRRIVHTLDITETKVIAAHVIPVLTQLKAKP